MSFFTAGSDTGLTNDRTKFEYDVTADVDALMNPDGSSCPKELIVFIHGFKGSPSGTFSRDLEQLGYDTKVSGADFKLVNFNWDSDRMGTYPIIVQGQLLFEIPAIAAFNRAGAVGENNGPKLAQFFVDFSDACPESATRIRVVSHSLGAKVALYTLKSLEVDETELDEGKTVSRPIIRSVHLVGAAVDNETPGVTEKTAGVERLGQYIQSQTVELFNFHSKKDSTLGALYSVARGFDIPLGRDGAQDSLKPDKDDDLPDNYTDTDILNELIEDTDGDGNRDKLKGKNHFGYFGIFKDGVLFDNGAVDQLLDDWYEQDSGILRKNCNVTVSLKKVTHTKTNTGFGTSTAGNKWEFAAAFAGEYYRSGKQTVEKDGTYTPSDFIVLNRAVIDRGSAKENLRFFYSAVEIDPFDNDSGFVGQDDFSVECMNSSFDRSLTVEAEG